MFAYESIVTLPDVVPSSPEVVAKANSSADSSHKNETFADEPLFMNKPISAELAPDTPEFNSNNVSLTAVFVVSTVVVVPETVKLPEMNTFLKPADDEPKS